MALLAVSGSVCIFNQTRASALVAIASIIIVVVAVICSIKTEGRRLGLRTLIVDIAQEHGTLEYELCSMNIEDLGFEVRVFLRTLAARVVDIESHPKRCGYPILRDVARSKFSSAFRDAARVNLVSKRVGWGPYFQNAS
jgi:hypothetical protein